MTKPESQAADGHYTTFEVARMLGMAVRSVQLMVDRKELEAWKTPGGHRRITHASVQRWLERHRGASSLSARGGMPARRGRPTTRNSLTGVAGGLGAVAATVGRPCVLLIEDSVHYQNLIRMLVEEHFPLVTLQTAQDGFSGLSMFGALQPDVLIVDLMLPGIDGATLITTLRFNPHFQNTRLLVVTSLGPAELEKYAFALNEVNVIHKINLVEQFPVKLGAALEPVAA